MKIVINEMLSSFVLSHEAIMLLAERKGKKIYPALVSFKDGKTVYSDYVENDVQGFKNIWHFTKPLQEIDFDHLKESDRLEYWDINRDDKDLVYVVEKLGEKAHYPLLNYMKLKVVEIPDDVKWSVEYNERKEGEEVVEEHRTWS